MGTSVTPQAPAAPAAPAAPVPATPSASGIIPAPNKPAVMSIAEAAEAGRELLRQRNEAITMPVPGSVPAARAAPANETPEQKAQREEDEAILAAESPEQRAAREATETAAAAAAAASGATAGDEIPDEPPAELTVQLGAVREGDEPLDIVMPDKEAADRVRALIRGAVRGDQARQIREQAQAIRDQAENVNYEIELDPAGAVLARVADPRDLDHLFRFLATRPGLLQRSVEWIADIIEHPETLPSQAAMTEAERITRRDNVRPKIEAKKSEDANARAVLRGVEHAIDELAPDSFNDEQRQRLYDYAKVEIRDFARARNLRVVDPKIASEAVAYVLKSFGVAPRDKSKPAPAASRGATQSAPPQKRQVTPEQILAARARRLSAASAPPGAGSATPSIPRAPKGSTIAQAAAHARQWYSSLRGRPQ